MTVPVEKLLQRLKSRPKFTTYECLRTITDLADGSSFKKEKHKKFLSKKFKNGQVIEVFDPDWREKAPLQARNEIDNREWLFRLSNALLYMGDYSWWGWEYRSTWAQMCFYNQEAMKMRLWDGESEKVLLLGEQGLGDEIMFGSCIPDMLSYGTEITIMCDKRLIPMFNRMGISAIPRVIGKELDEIHKVKDQFDSYFPLGELPRLFRRSVGDFPGTPFITPDPARLPEMAPYGGTGVSWRGRNGYYSQSDFKGLSLQYDQRWDEEPSPVHIDMINDIEGMIALVSVLDNIVCVSTTLAHIAGALGKDLSVILAPQSTRHPDNMINWRWRGGNVRTSPWYGSARIYRNLNEWDVAVKAKKHVRRFVEKSAA